MRSLPHFSEGPLSGPYVNSKNWNLQMNTNWNMFWIACLAFFSACSYTNQTTETTTKYVQAVLAQNSMQLRSRTYESRFMKSVVVISTPMITQIVMKTYNEIFRKRDKSYCRANHTNNTFSKMKGWITFQEKYLKN